MAFKKGVQPDGSWFVYAGDANSVSWNLIAAGSPWNLTGATVEAHARKVDTDSVPALVAECVVVAPLAGTVRISWDGESVRTLLAGTSSWSGVYDIQVTMTGGKPETYPPQQDHGEDGRDAMTTINIESNPLVTLEVGNEVSLDVDRHTITIESVEYMANLVVEGPQGPTGPMAAAAPTPPSTSTPKRCWTTSGPWSTT